MNEAMVCDRLAILHEGVLLADEPPRQLLWNKKAKIKILVEIRSRKSWSVITHSHYPILLQQFGLDTNISRIEIEEETLETVVLSMMEDHGKRHPGGDQ